jgi:cysteinyl-tRNA synthetase
MHKSLKNFITIREMLKNYDAEVLRLYYASTHYRKPINFNEKDVEQAKNRLESLYNTMRNLRQAASHEGKINGLKKDLAETRREFTDAMNNDFNTPLALAHLFTLSKKINKLISRSKVEANLVDEVLALFRELGTVLGILEGGIEVAEIPKDVENLVAEREEARKRKDWKRADALRGEIKKLGFLVEDAAEGPRCIKIKD